MTGHKKYIQFSGKMVQSPLPYGEDVKIIKHECVGHVQKKNGDGASEVEEVRYLG